MRDSATISPYATRGRLLRAARPAWQQPADMVAEGTVALERRVDLLADVRVVRRQLETTARSSRPSTGCVKPTPRNPERLERERGRRREFTSGMARGVEHRRSTSIGGGEPNTPRSGDYPRGSRAHDARIGVAVTVLLGRRATS